MTAPTCKYSCADCESKACELYDVERMPVFCLTKEIDQSYFTSEYETADIWMVHNAIRTEADGYCVNLRISRRKDL